MESSDSLGNQIPTELTVAIANVASRSPRIHCITNEAATSLTANVLLALGTQPSMTSDPSDVTQFVEQSDALSVNLGMLNDEKRGAIRHAVRTASNLEKPWIFGPRDDKCLGRPIKFLPKHAPLQPKCDSGKYYGN